MSAVALIAGLIILTRVVPAAPQPLLSGSFSVDQTVASDGRVELLVTVTVTNDGETPVHAVHVSVLPADQEASGDEFGAPAFYGSFEQESIEGGQSARLRQALVLPQDEWLRWQSGQGPAFWVSYVDAGFHHVGGSLRLSRATSVH